MRIAIRLLSIFLVSCVLFALTRCSKTDVSSPEEAAAYRDWAEKKATTAANNYALPPSLPGQAKDGGGRDFDLEPYNDPSLYGPESVVLGPGEVYTTTVTLKLPGAIYDAREEISLVDAKFDRDPQPRVVRNEWQKEGLQVSIDDVRVEAYLFNTWQLPQHRATRPIAVVRPDLDAEQTGSLSREEILDLMLDGAEFNIRGPFDPTFDLSRGKGCAHGAVVTYTIEIPRDLPVSRDDPSCWGRVEIDCRVGGDNHGFDLVHLRGRDGLALRPRGR